VCACVSCDQGVCYCNFQSIFFSFLGLGWGWVHLLRRPLIGLLYQLRMIDGDECVAVGGMRISRGNRSTRRKTAPVSLCPPQNPHDMTWARTRAAELWHGQFSWYLNGMLFLGMVSSVYNWGTHTRVAVQTLQPACHFNRFGFRNWYKIITSKHCNLFYAHRIFFGSCPQAYAVSRQFCPHGQTEGRDTLSVKTAPAFNITMSTLVRVWSFIYS
jgi:hypothetical protein